MGNQTNGSAVHAAINWYLDDHGLLTVNGTGKIPDYTQGNNRVAPWDHDKSLITSIVIGDGITEIGVNAFRDCLNLKDLKLPKTLKRIHAHAFRNCSGLTKVRSARKEWKYVYDHSDSDSLSKKYTLEETTVIFGVEAFLNVPWAKKKFKNYYIRDHVLYVCFSGEGKCIIPDGVQVLKKFAFSNIKTDGVVFPASLERIEDLAFTDAIIQGELILPDNLKDIGDYAFADCCFESIKLPEGMVPESVKRRAVCLSDSNQILPLQRIPKLAPKWYAGLKDLEDSDCFRRIQIMQKKPVHHKDGTMTSIWDSDYIDVGQAMLRKIQTGGTVFCITVEEGRVLETKAIYLERVIEDEKEFLIPCVYLMYPELTTEGELLPWNDSFTYFFRSEIRDAFPERNGRALSENGTLRFLDPDVQEEWFYCHKKESPGWDLTMDLLDLWHKQNPDIKIDTWKENRENDRYRWFVRI